SWETAVVFDPTGGVAPPPVEPEPNPEPEPEPEPEPPVEPPTEPHDEPLKPHQELVVINEDQGAWSRTEDGETLTFDASEAVGKAYFAARPGAHVLRVRLGSNGQTSNMGQVAQVRQQILDTCVQKGLKTVALCFSKPFAANYNGGQFASSGNRTFSITYALTHNVSDSHFMLSERDPDKPVAGMVLSVKQVEHAVAAHGKG